MNIFILICQMTQFEVDNVWGDLVHPENTHHVVTFY